MVRGKHASTLLALLPASCAPVDVSDNISDSEPPTCEVTIESVWPEDGANDAYYRSPVEIRLSEPDPTLSVSFEPSGELSTLDGGTTVLFAFDQPLQPDALYDYQVDYCHGAPSFSFTTSSYGAPVVNPQALLGHTFLVDLTSGRFTEGEGVGDTMSLFFTRGVLVQVVSVEDDEMTLILGVSTPLQGPVAQDPCFFTTEVTAAASESPFFELDIADFVFGAWRGSVGMYDFQMHGTLAADGSTVGGVSYRATVRASELGAVLKMDTEALCDLSEDLGVICAPCPDTAGQICITVAADRISAALAGVELEEVAEIGASCDP